MSDSEAVLNILLWTNLLGWGLALVQTTRLVASKGRRGARVSETPDTDPRKDGGT